MGEWSKKVGEIGEDIAWEFLQLVGWSAAQKGVQLPCVRPEAHKADGQRTTHGVDFLTAHPSPLVDGVGHNLVVSVKYSAKPYPGSPMKVFKEHFTDLAHTLECFKNSAVRREISRTMPGATRTQDIGVLLWINNDKDGASDMIGQVQKAILPDTLRYEAVYLVDNRRAQFVFDSVNFARGISGGCEVSFFYADTGKMVHPLRKTNHGPLLPVEYINASLLALRIADRNATKRILLLSSLDSFSEAAVKRLLGLAQNLSQDWCTKVILAFPDYDALNHGNMVQAAKGCFPGGSFIQSVEVHNYDADFRNLKP